MFHNVRLPEHIESGATGGPVFKTAVITLTSGIEQRNIEWARARGEWDIGYSVQTKQDYLEILKFFYARHGMAYGFRFKDWSDYEAFGQTLGIGGLNKDWRGVANSVTYSKAATYEVIQSFTLGSNGTTVTGIPAPLDTYPLTFRRGVSKLITVADPAAGLSAPYYANYLVEVIQGTSNKRDFPLIKTYTDIGGGYTRVITRPINDTIKAYIDGEERSFTVQPGGILRLNTIPTTGQVVTADFEFDVPVRFDVDKLDVEIEWENAGNIGSINIVELKENR